MSTEKNTNRPLVEVVLVNWNSFDDTSDCIRSLSEAEYPNLSITVVDNGSTDDSLERLKSTHPNVNYIVSDCNRGFSGGNNLGIRHALEAGAEYVLLLNNDTRVKPDFLTPLVKTAESTPNAGVVTGKILVEGTTPPEVWCAGGEYDLFRGRGIYYGHQGADSGEQDTGQYDTRKRVDLASGCLMLIRREVFNRVGYLPEEYFFGGEEWDFSASVREAGYEIWYVPESQIWHKVSSSIDQQFDDPWFLYNSERIQLLFVRNHLPYWKWFLWYMTHVVYVASIGLYKRYGQGKEHPDLNWTDMVKIKLAAELDHLRTDAITADQLNRIQRKFTGQDAI